MARPITVIDRMILAVEERFAKSTPSALPPKKHKIKLEITAIHPIASSLIHLSVINFISVSYK